MFKHAVKHHYFCNCIVQRFPNTKSIFTAVKNRKTWRRPQLFGLFSLTTSTAKPSINSISPSRASWGDWGIWFSWMPPCRGHGQLGEDPQLTRGIIYIHPIWPECFRIPLEVLENVAGEKDVWKTLLSLLPLWPGKAEHNGWIAMIIAFYQKKMTGCTPNSWQPKNKQHRHRRIQAVQKKITASKIFLHKGHLHCVRDESGRQKFC